MIRQLVRIALLTLAAAAALAVASSAQAAPWGLRMQTVIVKRTPLPHVEFNWDPIVWDSSSIFRWMEWQVFDWTTLTLREYSIGQNCCHSYGTETSFYVDMNHAYVYTVRACDIPNDGSSSSNTTFCTPYETGTFQTYVATPMPLPSGTIRWKSAAIQADATRAVGVTINRLGTTSVLLGR